MANEHALTTWRKENKLSQAEFAATVGVTRWMITRIENGFRRPSMGLAIRVQEVTGGRVTPNDFAGAMERAE